MSPQVPPGAARAVDGVLELTVAGSFTALGYRARSRLYGWSPPEPAAMAGRTVLVTGATSGLGLAAATELASLGARTIVLGRDAARTEAAAQRIAAGTGNDAVEPVVADLADLSAVAAVAEALLERLSGLDVLINNAGALTHDRVITRDGLELTYQTHVVAPFLLVDRLMPLLQGRPASRVITVSSGGMYAQGLDLRALRRGGEEYDGVRAYARAKRAQVVLNQRWAATAASPPVFHAMHPGWADTPGVVQSLPSFHRTVGRFLRTPQQGADTIVWLASAEEPAHSTGRFWLDRRPRGTVRLPWTATSADQARLLWDMVVADAGAAGRLTGPSS